MVVTFCGHSTFISNPEYKEKMLNLLESIVGNESAELYLGGYGNFDSFAYQCCKEYKKTHPNVSLVFVTPYLSEEYQKNHLNHISALYDYIVYPNIENKPQKFAIVYRNRYMVDSADFVISYITHKFGGAYQTYKYALKKENKHIIFQRKHFYRKNSR